LKKLLFGIICIIALVSLLIGCGEPASEETPTAPLQTSAPPTPLTTTPTTPAETGGPKYGGTFTLILTGSPGGNVGWPPEFIGNDNTTHQMIYQGLMRSLADRITPP